MVSQCGAVLIRGLFNGEDVRQVIPKINSSLDSLTLGGTVCGDNDIPRGNNFKWSVGAFSGAQIGNSRLMVIGYNPLNSPNVYGFHNYFHELIKIRDIVRGDSRSTADEYLQHNSFNACRFQIYPLGGGFMSGHRDYVAEQTSLQNGAALLQILMFVTQRGRDFQQGGAFLRHHDGELDIESFAESGDIAIYDGQSFHGVKDVDPFLPLCTHQIRGRIVALVTIYK